MPPPYVTLEIIFIGFSFSDHGLCYQLLEPVVTTEFSILELACSQPGSYHEPMFPQVLGPPELQHIRPLGLTQSLIGEGSPALYVVLSHYRYTMWD